ncbi:MAG: deoxyribodipyrimidine photo-lyase [bacterium]|nr:deoxyribodipyrimidine photo-lyase [candidate division KSB1 bacterium]MDH7561109.1 deoxyribodipyrimidine photo-lyase [bacterium]
MIHPERIRALNGKPVRKGKYVLYWMQASQRAEYNHALEYAIQRANELGLPIVTFFGLTGSFPEANARHYAFMLQGLAEVESALRERGISFLVRHGPPEKEVVRVANEAALVVVDCGYLRLQRQWRQLAAARLPCLLGQVETDVVVPIEVASDKEEYSAATLRRKLAQHLEYFLKPLAAREPRVPSSGIDLEGLSLADIGALWTLLAVDRSVPPSPLFRGGTGEAKRRLRAFIAQKLDRFAELRNDPSVDYLSHMSPYLHFGQISPLYIALQVQATGSPGVPAYLEELIVRRELSMNFVYFNPHYDSFAGLPAWAQKTLQKHLADARPYSYSLAELEQAQTHDPCWNAAQQEMVLTGKMHGYMRMYWGKKILEWSPTPAEAFSRCLHLNNKYEIDGRDPNGFAGVAWCFGKHDRPWGERPVFGNVRSMTEAGLRRKFDVERYVRAVQRHQQAKPDEPV